MKRLIGIITVLLFTSMNIKGQKPGIGMYSTTEKSDKVFNAAMKAATSVKFSVKNTDKANGTIQAEMNITGSSGKVVNLFVTVTQDSVKTVVEATFTKPWGVTGSMSKFAKAYGEEIKKTIPDLEITVKDNN
jgi:hypothetical protein